MLAEERQRHIIEYLQKSGFAKVSDLSKKFNVSMETIRRDMDVLESRGVLKKTHGGAILKDRVKTVLPISQRLTINTQQKEAIARASLSFIEDGNSIILDSGTTTLAIASCLGNVNVKVVTNDVAIAKELAGKEYVDLMVTGGTLVKGSYSLVGPECISMLQCINADKLFLAASGVDKVAGLTISNALEAEVKRQMIASAKQVILVVDSSKFSNCSLISYAHLSSVHLIITDIGIPQDIEQTITDMGIKIHKVMAL